MKRILVDVGAGSTERYKPPFKGQFDEWVLIEPHPVLARSLLRQVKDKSHVKVLHKALVPDEESPNLLSISRPAIWSSLAPATGLLKRYPSFKIIREDSVELMSLNSLQSILGSCALSIRFDCCGAELELLEVLFSKAFGTCQIDRVAVVVGVQAEFSNSASSDEIIDFLRSRSYECNKREVGARVVLDFTFSKLIKKAIEQQKTEEDLISLKDQVLALKLQAKEQEERIQQLQLLNETNVRELESYKSGVASDSISSEAELVLKTLSTLEATLSKKIRLSSETTVKQVESYMGIRDYLSSGEKGLSFHGWPISSQVGLYLLGLIEDHEYQCVIEFGSGTSTVMFADALLKKALRHDAKLAGKTLIGDGNKPVIEHRDHTTLPSEHDLPRRVVSFEHNKKYLNQTRQLLETRDLQHLVNLVYAPLNDHSIAEENWLYYNCEKSLADLAGMLNGTGRILVLIDGPPQQTGDKARFPALPLLVKHLGNHAFDVIVDDYARNAEKEIVQEWRAFLDSRSYQYEGEEIEAEKGAYHLRIG